MHGSALRHKFYITSVIAISNNLAFSRGISMTFTLQDLKNLEIITKLEEKPAPPPEELAVVVATPTSLTEKLLTLAHKLHKAGYNQQAENLEQKFSTYKKAEVDANLLYRAHSETGDDLLEFAHPDGDIEIAPAQDEHGCVETPISQHNKILKVVQKSAQLNNPIAHTVIVQKFEYVKNFVSTNFLKADGDSKDPKYAQYLEVASDLFNLCDNIIKTFSTPGQSSEYIIVSAINEAVNDLFKAGEQNPHFTSMNDVNVFLNAFINKIQQMKPVAKKAAIIEMLKKTLNIKLAEDTNEEDEDFKAIVNDVTSTIDSYLKSLWQEPYASVKMYNNNKTVGDYNYVFQNRISKARSAILQYSLGRRTGKQDVKQKSANAVDDLLKIAFSFASNLNETMIAALKQPKDPFDNHQFPKILIGVLNGLNNRYLTFYNKYLSNADENEKNQHIHWHSQFLTANMLHELISPHVADLSALKRFIQANILTDSHVKESKLVFEYLGKLIGFIDGVNGDFGKFLALTGGEKTTLMDDNGNITLEQVKKSLANSQAGSVLQFDTINNFKMSLSKIYNLLINKVEQVINSNSSLAASRENLLAQIKTMNKVIGK